MTTPLLHAQLDYPLPREVAVGRGTALFASGWCFCPDAEIRSLALIVDGQTQPLMAYGMSRRDILQAYHRGRDARAAARSPADSFGDPALRSVRSGFWGFAQLFPRSDHSCRTLGLRAELEDGSVASVELASVREVSRTNRVELTRRWSSPERRVAICMATHDPAPDLLTRQLESIRNQTHPGWVCIISDDCSRAERFSFLRQAIGDDPRFVITRSERRLGFYGNFERVLSLVPADADYVALADQDDDWHPDKLETLLAEIGGAQLVYSDARIVAASGELVATTYWSRRRNNHSSLTSLLLTNSVTGAASMFRRELLDYALPFPPAQFAHFHDHWIALTALALGEIAFVERPLYDYVQHGEASLGHAAAARARPQRGRWWRRSSRERLGQWREQYFGDVCRLMQFATVLRMRCAERLAPAKRAVLERFMRAEHSFPSLAAVAVRGTRELVGQPATLGAEWLVSRAFAWRRLVALTNRPWLPERARLGATPPRELLREHKRDGLRGTAPAVLAEKIGPLDLIVRDDVPRRVNVLIPTIDLEHFFGGYIAKLNLARRLGERGIRVRIITVDPVEPLPHLWTQRLESYSGLAGVFDLLEVEFGHEEPWIEISPSDRFIATTWWTAHIAHSALDQVHGNSFLYLIQEYEPFTFPMGSYAALARASYGLPHHALFSTELLRDYFRRHRIGVYSAGAAAGDAMSIAFENAITPIEPPTAEVLTGRRTRRMLFYARPEPHAARNMFELGILAIRRAIADDCLTANWELNGIGTVRSESRIPLGGGRELRLLPRSE
ncbi:MAG: glycosyltransferase, partial [Solirubrobacterales bacterium]|nr:glycosyltransferase [Solirubrobacterales bacterium]